MFENFLYRTLTKLRRDKGTRHKRIVIFLDNATTHRGAHLQTLAERMGVTFLFNAEYSPYLNPAEELFNVLKRHISQLPHKPDK
jgi:transposase